MRFLKEFHQCSSCNLFRKEIEIETIRSVAHIPYIPTKRRKKKRLSTNPKPQKQLCARENLIIGETT